MKKEKLEKNALILLIIVGLFYAYFTYLFLPQWAVIGQTTGELRGREDYYRQLVDYRSNPAQLNQEIQGLEAQQKQLAAQIPSRLDEPTIMMDIYNLAKRKGVYPQSLSFEQKQDKGTHQELVMNLSTIGARADILSMINELQHGDTLRLSIQNVNLTTEGGLTRGTMQLTAYAAKPGATPVGK